MAVAEGIERGQRRGDIDSQVNPMNSAVFFLLGLYALLITTNAWPTRDAMLDDYVTRTLRGMEASGRK